ncbi:MAG: hypothetical protein GY937_02070 [bacterium]|nr:hypothetical protein [bacterium]
MSRAGIGAQLNPNAGGRTAVVKRVEIFRYFAVAALLAFATIAAAWSVFAPEDSVHHFDSSETGPFSTSFTFLLLLLVGADVLGILWLIRRFRGRN